MSNNNPQNASDSLAPYSLGAPITSSTPSSSQNLNIPLPAHLRDEHVASSSASAKTAVATPMQVPSTENIHDTTISRDTAVLNVDQAEFPSRSESDDQTIHGSEGEPKSDHSSAGKRMNEKAVVNEKSVRVHDRLGDAEKGRHSDDLDEKKAPAGIEGQVQELEGGKVYLGTENATGKAIIKDKEMLKGGPYTKPKWHHSLPLLHARNPPPPPPGTMEDAKTIPDKSANFFSFLLFSWIEPMMALGAARELAPEDLWKMDRERDADVMSAKLKVAFQRRWEKAEEYNIKLEKGEVAVPMKKKLQWRLNRGSEKGKTYDEKSADWRNRTGKKQPSLAWALSDVFGWYFWAAGAFKIYADTAQITTSLLVRAIIRFSSDYHAARANGTAPPEIGKGIGMCIGLLAMLLTSSLALNHFFLRSAGVGVLSRAALISALYEKSLTLTNRSRIQHPNGKLVNHISTDVSRVDFCAGFFHMVWTAPIQFIVAVIILLVQIRESALVGIGFLLLLSPIQLKVMAHLFSVRKKSMVWTDKRARLLQEILSGIKVVKLMAWEAPFLKRLDAIRKNELTFVRKLMVTRSANMAVAMSVPVIAAILSFVTYASIGNNLDPATLFTVLTLFQMIRLPLLIFPMTLSSITDARNALGRLSLVFMAETMTEQRVVEPSADFAIKVSGATFTWDSSAPVVDVNAKKKKALNLDADGRIVNGPGRMQRMGKTMRKPFKWIRNRKTRKIELAKQAHVEIAAKQTGLMEAGTLQETREPGLSENAGGDVETTEERIFSLRDVDIEIPKGALVAIVGEIGSGKSSLLSGIMGEMRRTEGKVVFGGSTALVPQTPWIMNATVRENILFNLPFDEERYWKIIHDAQLPSDLDLLKNGDAETIGEKGVSLSGGQKARVSLARAAYYGADITIFDDPLAAVDPGVASALFDTISNMQGTRILVTHAIHFMPQVDYIICMSQGEIVERGTYTELQEAQGEFAALMKEFANDGHKEEEEDEIEGEAIEKAGKPAEIPRERMTANVKEALANQEVIHAGLMGSKTYAGWLKAANGWVTVPMLFIAIVIAQAFTIITGFMLVWWQTDAWNTSYSVYEGVYVVFGLASAFFLFVMGWVQALSVYNASVTLHDRMINRIMHAPSGWFDVTPIGRILNRLSKDVDTLDNTLGDAMRMLVSTLANIVGAVILIAIVSPWFLIAVVVVFTIYGQLAWWYQKSALAFKRIDGVLRSPLYAHFSESLAGVAVIRSFNESERFIADNCRYMTTENRAYYLTVVNQRWLGIRLDGLGSLLTFIVGIIVIVSDDISPSKGGLVLSYMLTVQQSFSWLCRQAAEVQNDMASAERVLEYATDLEQEKPHEIPENKPPANWPSEGRIEFENVVMGYRPELPPVLKNFSLTVGKHTKIGVIGRTGAGKSTIMSTLYRLVEVRSGSIKIDGIDIAEIGLTDLRSGLSIIPQEAVLFSGTIRSNIDPFGQKSDADLWDAMRRAHLIDSVDSERAIRKSLAMDRGTSTPQEPGTATPHANASRFTLDTIVDEDGSNFSAGERSLISLARAIVRDARIVVLDEATASVDLATDAKIQQTIRTEFKDKTLLCIAHRIRTILHYDQILVMNAGEVAEFDTPENLFLQGGLFRESCEKSNITIEEVKQAASLRSH